MERINGTSALDNTKEKTNMAAIATSPQVETRIEDVLAHLPVSATIDYLKDQIIFSPQNPSRSIYLVVTGNVRISSIAENGAEVLMEIVRPDELFGDAALLGAVCSSERATSIDKVRVMAWAAADIQEMVMKRPRLGLALVQIVVQRSIECNQRIGALSHHTIEQRLAWSLLRFSERLGSPEQDGSIRMMPFTHEMLARYVGTSREIITTSMNRFRRLGLVKYSRSNIIIYCDMLKSVLDRKGFVSASRTPGLLTV
jgi:CRP-like cAMP-binding protein